MTVAAIMICAGLMAIDGDTVRCCESATGKCEGQNLRPMGAGAPFVSGFDTPEISWRARCPIESELAFRAAARFAELLRTPGLVVEDSGVLDESDRPLVWLRLPDGSTIGQKLIEEGHAKEWRPNQSNYWCQ